MPKLKVGPARGCRLGYCATRGFIYAGGNDWVKKQIGKGICPLCKGKLRRQK